MVQCISVVNRSNIRRESINGVEHIIVSSSTLPDDVVMNGGLYPAEEIEKSFMSLDRTLAPVEHPIDSKGNFLSASDPESIHNFHAGAFNMNVRRENGVVHIEKHINVQEAMKTDRGKRLLDRIEEIETNDKPRPIHTSVGVFLFVEDVDPAQKNNQGDEYTWVARDMVFDHDAILLDSQGAATPEQGVGMAINADGEKIDVDRVFIDNTCKQPSDNQLRAKYRQKIKANAESFRSIMEKLQQKIENIVAAEWLYLVDVFEDNVIFETNQGFFSVPYDLREGEVVIAGVPIRVERQVEYQPKLNSQKEECMKELILNVLKEAGIETDGLDDDGLLAAYNKLQAKENDDDGTGDGDDTNAGADAIADAVTNAIKPLTDKVDALAVKVNAKDEADRDAMVKTIINSKKYPGLDEEAAKAIPLETLKGMAASCGTAHGVPMTNDSGGEDNTYSAPTEMPK